MDKIKQHKIKAVFQIVLLVCASFAFAYIADESINGKDAKIGRGSISKVLPLIFGLIGKIIFSDLKSASAVGVSDLSSGVDTCIESKDGKICQEYLSSECNNKCKDVCLPARRDLVAECKPGTCFDSVEGTCQAGSPKIICEKNGGQWYDDKFENIAQCREGCCVIGEQTAYLTERQCFRQGNVLGVEEEFKPEIKTEIECLALAKTQEEGACVTDATGNNGLPVKNCLFTTKKSCLEIRGVFWANRLCSNPELNTACVKQATAKCVEGRDEIYWFDSCGNRENIYDANKEKSWNKGLVLNKADSCNVRSASNAVANQKTCGNCNYLLGSTCGRKTSREKLADAGIDVVCRDLSCVDEKGQRRENGESWCNYQSAIGADGVLRSKDTPGSRYFVKRCVDGEVATEPCQDYRTEVCSEEDTTLPNGRIFKSAVCRANMWQKCMEFDTEYDNQAMEPEDAEDCTNHPDCYLKKVDVDDNFKFSFCVPKYPPGFDVRGEGEDSAQMLCGFANQKCTYAETKSITGKWKCKVNCDCKEAEFAEKMNDFCMSLGDCGASVNYIGSYTKNYLTSGNAKPQVSSAYVNQIAEYYKPVEGQRIDTKKLAEYLGSSEFKTGPEAQEEEGMFEGTIGKTLLTSGAVGGTLLLGVYTLGTTGGPFIAGAAGVIHGFSVGATSPVAAGLGGALMGAAIGAAVSALLIKFALGEDIEEEAVYGLIAAGAVAGAMIGLSMVSQAAWTAWIGWPLAVAVIIVIVWGAITGWGDTRERTVEFKCRPWQAPIGGDYCKKCGADGLPCSPYACHSLGQTCEFINAGSNKEMCVNIHPDDAAAPIIKPWNDIISESIKYDEVSDLGFKVKNKQGDGCIKEYERIVFGIELNEPGQCRYEFEHTGKFDDMSEDTENSLFVYEHNISLRMPALSEIGVTGFDPNRRGQINMFVRCRDANGRTNVNEYAIQYCAAPAEDITPPVITAREPVIEFVSYNATNITGIVYTNEPAECKWSEINQDYDLMIHNMTCANDINQEVMQGFGCQDNFNAGGNQTKYYIRCKDQPWYSGSGENKRNKNSNSYEFNIKKSSGALKIESIKISPTTQNIPYIKLDNQTFAFGSEPISLNFQMNTAGGMNGEANCKYKIGSLYTDFFLTNKKVHEQVFENFGSGVKILPVKCVDKAGNEAVGEIRANITLDKSAPNVARVLGGSGTLTIVTDEDARCYYNNNGCGFSIENSTESIEMSGAEKVHTASLEKDEIYYIKCKDKFSNYMGDCNAIVRGGI